MVRFNDGDSEYLTFTLSGNGNRKNLLILLVKGQISLELNSNILGSLDGGLEMVGSCNFQ